MIAKISHTLSRFFVNFRDNFLSLRAITSSLKVFQIYEYMII